MAKVAMQEMTRPGGNGTSKHKIQVDYVSVKKAAGVLRAINHALRQGILSLLEERGPITVTELYNRLNLEQSVASQHLAILRRRWNESGSLSTSIPISIFPIRWLPLYIVRGRCTLKL